MPKVTEWFTANQLSLNADKTYYQLYRKKRVVFEISIKLTDVKIDRATTVQNLGVFIDQDMNWRTRTSKLQTVLSRNKGNEQVEIFIGHEAPLAFI